MSLSRFKEKGLNGTPRGERSETVATLKTARSFHEAVGVLAEPPEEGPAALRGGVSARWVQARPCGPSGPGTWLRLYFQSSRKPVEGSRTQWPGGRP